METRPLIACIIGTRPDVIKMAPVIQALQAHPARYRVTVVSAGQHRALHDRMCRTFGIRPGRNLRLLRPGADPAAAAARAVTGFSALFTADRPTLVIVQGDTTTALGAARAACYGSIPVAHVEAGLRTHDPRDPFPEEMNRRTISTLAALHFAPTPGAAANLRKEGVPGGTIFVTGNTVVDALTQVTAAAYPFTRRTLAAFLQPGARPFIICTIHRRENRGRILAGLLKALTRIAAAFPSYSIILPVHPNPAVHVPVKQALEGRGSIRLIRPLDYPDMLQLLGRARLVITDSGGLQEEAAVLGTPTLVLRQKTERPELLAAGIGILAGIQPDTIVRLARKILCDTKTYNSMHHPSAIFGTGAAGKKIERHIRAFLAKKLSKG